MVNYDLGEGVEAFSTNINDALDFDVTLPLHQAHSAKVVALPIKPAPMSSTSQFRCEETAAITGVDALITNQKGLRIGVKTADCVPILLYDKGQKSIAAIHSGWKGTVQNIIKNAVIRMAEEYGTKPEDIRAVIGPCIHLEAFEVGDEVYDIFFQKGYGQFAKRFLHTDSTDSADFILKTEFFSAEFLSKKEKNPLNPLNLREKKTLESVCKTQPEKWHIDLPSICEYQLNQEGITDVEVRPECTFTLHHEFYSSRRLGKSFDRQRIFNCIKLL